MEKWTPLRPAALPREAFDVERYLAMGMDRAAAEAMVAECRASRVWVNDLYQVNVTENVPVAEGWPAMDHLSIKRRDKRAVRDWRHLQLIKNQLCGPEREAVELFPAESRLTDSANQYHLWVLRDEALRFPFGWQTRFVAGPGEDGGSGVVVPNVTQRPFPIIEEAP